MAVRAAEHQRLENRSSILGALRCGRAVLVLAVHRRHLDVMRVGDDEARKPLVSIPVRVRLLLILVASLMTAAAVSVSGLIAFVGLVVPHIVRLTGRLTATGSWCRCRPWSVRRSWPSVDVGARTLVPPRLSCRLVMITAFVGAPFFAFVLWHGSRGSAT